MLGSVLWLSLWTSQRPLIDWTMSSWQQRWSRMDLTGALMFIHNYLKRRKHRVKVNGSFSEWKEINKGVPQESVLGPLLFNNLFMFVPDIEICKYAYDHD